MSGRRFINVAAASNARHVAASLGYDINVGVPIATFCTGVQLTSDAKTVSIYLSNRAVGVTGPQADIATVDVAVYKSDGTRRSIATGSAVKVWTNQTIPGADNSELVLSLTDLEVASALGTDNQFVIVYSTPLNATVITMANVQWGQYLYGTAQVNPLPGGFAAMPSAVMNIGVYYTTARPSIICQVDSLTQGYDTSGVLFRIDSAYCKIGWANNWSVDTIGKAGTTLAAWNTGIVNLETGMLPVGCIGVTEAGLNDLVNGASASALLSLLATRVTTWQSAGFRKIIACTLSPSAALSGGGETERQSFNTSIRGGISGVDDFCDVDAIVRDPMNHAILLAAYDSGDGTHWNTAGHAAVATALTTTITPFI
jgi:hypothetical protein